MGSLLITLALGFAWVLALIPAPLYLLTGWRSRRDRLFGVLSDDALKRYYQQFRRMQRPPAGLRSAFQKHFGAEYGRRHYVVPVVLMAAVVAIGLWGSAQTVYTWVGMKPVPLALPPIAASAFLGALTWVIGDQLGRLRNQDFTPHDVYGCAYRLLIAVPVGYAITATVKEDLGVPVAFLLGVFPTTTLTTIARRLSAQRFGLGDSPTPDSAVNELGQLQGIGRAHAERFEENGVNTIVELAWSDPIDLTVRTNFDLWFVVDCLSQALLWVYLGPKVSEVFRFTLRGSMEAYLLLQDLSGKDPATKAAAQASLDAAASSLGMTADSLRYTLEEAAKDPYTLFLCDIWGEEP